MLTDERNAERWLSGALAWLEGFDGNPAIAFLSGARAPGYQPLLACISEVERVSAGTISVDSDRLHFVLRRAFQRSFVAKLTAWQGPLAGIALTSARDRRPECVDAPGLCLAFSSTGLTLMAGAWRGGFIGVDIERLRPVSQAAELARRFFLQTEIDHLAGFSGAALDAEFLRLWTIKEACLKAIGKGLDFGIQAFRVCPDGKNYRVEPPPAFGPSGRWSVTSLAAPEGCLASIVHCGADKQPS